MKKELIDFLKNLGSTNVSYSGHRRGFYYINQDKQSCFISSNELVEIKKVPKQFHQKLIM